MFKRNLLFVLILALALAACNGEATTTPTVASKPQVYPSNGNAYPAPEAIASPYAPAVGDEALTRASASIDLQASQLAVMESQPVQVTLLLKGNLPTPCHKLRVVIFPANEQREINLEVYSVVDPNAVCAQVLEPLDVSLPLGSFSGGKFTVLINGEVLASFDA